MSKTTQKSLESNLQAVVRVRGEVIKYTKYHPQMLFLDS